MAKRGRPKSKGLGDTIAKVTKATGIDRVVKAVVGDDCGCDERREKLNRIFPYHKNITMTDDQRSIWSRLRSHILRGIDITHSQREAMRLLHNSIFGNRYKKPTTCITCLNDMKNKLETLYQNQCNAD